MEVVGDFSFVLLFIVFINNNIIINNSKLVKKFGTGRVMKKVSSVKFTVGFKLT